MARRAFVIDRKFLPRISNDVFTVLPVRILDVCPQRTLWKYLSYRERYTYRANLHPGEQESAESLLSEMLEAATPEVMAALNLIEIYW